MENPAFTKPPGRHYTWVCILLVFVFITSLLPGLPGFGFDNFCWYSWSQHIFRHGLSNAYGSGTNYLPLYQYVLWGYGRLAGSEDAIRGQVNYLRCFTLLFDFWGLWLVYKWAGLKTGFLVVLCLGIMNVAYSYNTVIWGQVDGIVATLVFAALYSAHSRRLVLSGVACVLAVNMKLQAIVFLPVWGLLMLEAAASGGRGRAVLTMLAAMVVLQVLLVLPFAFGDKGIKPVWNVVINSAGFFQAVSLNAYNFWSWFVPDPIDVQDNRLVAGLITYNKAGLLLFCVSSLAALIPMMRKVLHRFRHSQNAALIRREEVWLTAALIALLFFFFNTRMHERYAHPAFIFITAYAFYARRFAALIIFSAGYFLNLEGVLHWLKLPNYGVLVFDARFVACLFAIVILYLFIRLYRKERLPEFTELPIARV